VARDLAGYSLSPPLVLICSVMLEGVRARYTDVPQPALDGVDLCLPAGGRVALVGPSGAGKYTIVDLLLRVRDPEHGRITLGGRDLRGYRETDIRRALAGGDRRHISSRPASPRTYASAGRMPTTPTSRPRSVRHASGWVRSLPAGGTRGSARKGASCPVASDSGSSSPRALLADAPVLILDEPTAHLDPETADALLHDVFAAAGHRSVLLITHRTEGLDLVDQVVTLVAGRVV
jgi:ATP-binding cassette, subfamily C, bacterial CydC